MVAAAAPLLAGCNAGAVQTSDAPSLPDAQPLTDWMRVVTRGWPDQAGFSLLLPGWTLKEVQGIDSYVGEVTGDGTRLILD